MVVWLVMGVWLQLLDARGLKSGLGGEGKGGAPNLPHEWEIGSSLVPLFSSGQETLWFAPSLHVTYRLP